MVTTGSWVGVSKRPSDAGWLAVEGLADGMGTGAAGEEAQAVSQRAPSKNRWKKIVFFMFCSILPFRRWIVKKSFRRRQK